MYTIWRCCIYEIFCNWIPTYWGETRVKIYYWILFPWWCEPRGFDDGCERATWGTMESTTGGWGRFHSIQWLFLVRWCVGHSFHIKCDSKALSRPRIRWGRYVLCSGSWLSRGGWRCESLLHEEMVQHELSLLGARNRRWCELAIAIHRLSRWVSSGEVIRYRNETCLGGSFHILAISRF